MFCVGRPSVLLLADSMRAHMPTNSGDARLVPPTCWLAWPLITISAPEPEAASNATSGTWRLVTDEPSAEVCHAGAFSNRLTPPPVAHRRSSRVLSLLMWARPSFHTVSPVHVVVPLVLSVVPPTATTFGEVAGSLTP